MPSAFLGIDPGVSGGMALLSAEGVVLELRPMPEDEEAVVDLITDIAMQRHASVGVFAILERVNTHRGWHAAGAFTFGRNVGAIRAALYGADIPHDEVSPAQWMRALGCLTRGDKRVTLRRARQLFPAQRLTHAVADALLLAEYGRRQRQSTGH
jgi:hypothetical protein